MCGIIGYIGSRAAPEILLEGLAKLEYRGYDSAGIATVVDGEIDLRRAEGKLEQLRSVLDGNPVGGNIGIGHTRWATHGRPSEINAHPHRYGNVVVVHNGIIENHRKLRAELESLGNKFESETDTEIVAHLVQRYRGEGESPLGAVQKAVRKIEGAYALCVAFGDAPDTLVAAKLSSPLIIGYGENESFVASDIPAILRHTRSIDYLNDGEVAEIRAGEINLYSLDGTAVSREPKKITWDPIAAEKGGHKHFMHKEIFEQPSALVNALEGRVLMHEGDVSFEDFSLDKQAAAKIERVYVIACGTAWHAGLIAKAYIEQFARVPTEVDLASEFRYRNPLVDESCLTVVISQSGETADTLAALREAKRLGSRTLAICNVMESSIAREADDVIYTHAGPEIGVASTKAFMTQIAVAYLFALYLARRREAMDDLQVHELLAAITRVPMQIKKILAQESIIRDQAKAYRNMKGYLFLGRGLHFPIALEGALKLKEISYLHAEGYAAGEMKHGPIALVEEAMLIVGIAPCDSTYEKVLSNLEEVRARGGRVMALCCDQHPTEGELAESCFAIPHSDSAVTPFLTVVPLQLFSYHIADLKGNDVDQPRNLAKSVTVE
jgi:glutamine---fructose-6-phosphate transaminase (isomerizing)